jgi:hypothetical protein
VAPRRVDAANRHQPARLRIVLRDLSDAPVVVRHALVEMAQLLGQPCNSARNSSLSRLSASSRISASRPRTAARPSAISMPYSSSRPRTCLTWAVR